jgi:hypothetical protein
MRAISRWNASGVAPGTGGGVCSQAERDSVSRGSRITATTSS